MPPAPGIAKPSPSPSPSQHSQSQLHRQAQRNPSSRQSQLSSNISSNDQNSSTPNVHQQPLHQPSTTRRQHSPAQLFSRKPPPPSSQFNLNCSRGGEELQSSTPSGAAPSDSKNAPPSSAQCSTLLKPNGPILTLSPQTIGLLDPTQLETVYSLWTVFSKCSEALENGRRLENMSWRLWNRELFLNPLEFNHNKGTLEELQARSPLNFLNEQDQDPRVSQSSHLPDQGEQKSSSNISVPDLHQVPKLSSSVESSASSCTTSSNNKGSNDKLPTTRPLSPQFPTVSISKKNSEEDSRKAFQKRKMKQLSAEKLRELLKLFNPDTQDEYLKPIGTKRTLHLSRKDPKVQSSGTMDEQNSSPASYSSQFSQDSTTPQPSNTNSFDTSLRSNPSINDRKSSSLFQNPPPSQNHMPQQHYRADFTSNKSNLSLGKHSASKRNSQVSLQNVTKQPSEPRPNVQHSHANNTFKKPSPKLLNSNKFPSHNSHESTQKLPVLPTAPKVPSNLSMTHLTTKSSSNIAQPISNAKLLRTNSSLFQNREVTKRPSLFSQPSQLSKQLPQEASKSNISERLANQKASTSKQSLSEYSDIDSSDHNDASDTDADSESGSDFEGIDSNGSRLTYKNRTSTSTSIVRGFSPSSISVSAIPKGSRSSVQLSSSSTSKVTTKPTSMFEMTKARPDKVPREKMFFIESSSPSESENGMNSLSSQGGFSEGPRKFNSSESLTNLVNAERHASLFSPQPTAQSNPQSQNQPPAPSSTQRPQVSYSPDPRSVIEPLEAVSEHDDSEVENDEEGDEEDDDYDDDSAWDSVDDESDSESFDETAFIRDESKPKPLVRPSLLSSLFLNNPEKLIEEQEVQNSSSSVVSDQLYRSPEALPQTQGSSLDKKGFSSLGRSPSAIRAGSNLSMVAREPSQTRNSFTLMSPRTTRRNMLASELSESVRRDLLWERKQISTLNPVRMSFSQAADVGYSDDGQTMEATTALGEPSEEEKESIKNGKSSSASAKAKLVRRHTSSDVAALSKRNPLPKLTMPGESWKQDLEEDTKGDFNYHARGW